MNFFNRYSPAKSQSPTPSPRTGALPRSGLLPLTALAALALLAPNARAEVNPHLVWLEGETPTQSNPPAKIDAWGGSLLSGGSWLHYALKGNEVDAQAPDGIALTYSFEAGSAGNYEVWNRAGYEGVRAGFDWRLDGGDWQSIAAGAHGVDLVELAEWNPVAWLKLGAAPLTAGKHTLEIRVPKVKNAKGATADLVYASDAIVLSPTPFHPNDQYKPGDGSWQSETDRAAARQVFQCHPAAGAAQTRTSLKGNWQIARYDEDDITDTDGPLTAAPAPESLNWKSMAVPGDRNKARPEWTYAHRYFLRTRIDLPADCGTRSWYLHFPSVNLTATLFVNGAQCGFTKTPFANWDADISRAVHPGTNEVCVGIKDIYYARPLKSAGATQYVDYLPLTKVAAYGPDAFTYPIWNHYESGILVEPAVVSAGKTYTSDVFAIPSVQNKTLGLEITLKNPTDQVRAVEVQNEVVPLAGGVAEKTFAPRTVTLAPNSEQVVKLSEPWEKPRLWWPDDPQQYNVVTRIVDAGAPLDERRTKFGFREWSWNGPNFKLNGINWYGRADTAVFGAQSETDLAGHKAHGETMIRLWGENGWHELDNSEDALDFFDSHGMPIRRTGIFDGETVRYDLTESDGKGKSQARRALFDNWRNQLLAWAKGQRNHPSIFVWSMENEITFINSSVRGQNPQTDPEMTRAATELAALDPTRPQMVDGGNALLDDSLPIYGIHYIEGQPAQYPEWGYNLTPKAIEHSQKWPISSVKPLFFGETYFAPGYTLGSLAAVGGESTLVGKAEARPAIALLARMMTESYRWSGVAAFHFWKPQDNDANYNPWQPLAVLCRQWDWSFPSGAKVARTLGIFNDSHEARALTLTMTLEAGGKTVGTQSAQYTVGPGQNQKFDVTLALPTVTARTEGHWTLALVAAGKTIFSEAKPLSILPDGPLPLVPASPVGATEVATIRATKPGPGLLVYDPVGTVTAYFKRRALPFTALENLDALPASGRILVVGKDALTAAQSTSSQLAAWAAAGRTVVVLEQKNALHFQGLPATMNLTADAGSMGFPEDLDHPAFHGLTKADFANWGPGGALYAAAYEKPTRGGRSLLQCGSGLADTALVEVPAGKGLLLLSQLTVGEKLATNAVAQRLLLNLMAYGAGYQPITRAVYFAGAGNPQLKAAVDAIGVQYTAVQDPLEAMAHPGAVAVVAATPDTLKNLAGDLPRVKSFTASGGWLMLCGLTPEGLADYDKIVGFDHVIRKFGREKVSFATERRPLIAGLSASDVVMGSGKRIFGFQAGDYPAEDAYSYVVDLDEVAPFGKSSFAAYGNITNNFTNADGWPLIINFPAPADGKPYDIPIALPKEEEIKGFTFVGNNNYYPETKVQLVFNGTDAVEFVTPPDGEAHSFEVNPPRRAKDLILRLNAWDVVPGKTANLGIDNIYLYAARPNGFAEKVRPLLNIGALVEYPQGPGGIVLNEVNFQESEALPENKSKKRAILTVLLRNLGAPLAGSKSIIAGADLVYTTLDISKQANAYRTDGALFGDKAYSFRDLPTGKQTLAGVPFNIYDLATSPVPTVVMLSGNGVPGNLADNVAGIPVNTQADALFFLQTARVDRARSANDIKANRHLEVGHYVVHYADGSTENVPLYAGENVDNFRQAQPAPLPGAQVAWTRRYDNSDQTAVAYSMQWNNPHPDLMITSIDLRYGTDRAGVPALLALTAATAQSGSPKKP